MALPFDLENERAIVTSAIRDPNARRAILGSVSPDDFVGERFRNIFFALQECSRKNLNIDADAIAIHAPGDFGEHEYLRRIFSLEPSTNIEFHITKLKQDSSRVKAKTDLIPKLEKMMLDKTVTHDDCLRALSELDATMRISSFGKANTAELWNQDFDMRCQGKFHFQSVGYESLNSVLLDGYGKGLVTVIAGRTRNGKSTLITDTVRRLLAEPVKPKICVLPLEVGGNRFVDKLVSSALMVPLNRLRKNPKELTLSERDEFKKCVLKMVGTDDRLTVLENPFFSLPDWTNQSALDKLEEILAQGHYDIVFMDLFQRMLVDLRPQSIEVALIKVQNMAKKYSVHMGLAHQIGRKMFDERKDLRPHIEDLKGSGGYEEIPDLILLLHRPKAYKSFKKMDTVEVYVGKQRDGPVGQTMVSEFYPAISRLEKDRFATEDELGDSQEEQPAQFI